MRKIPALILLLLLCLVTLFTAACSSQSADSRPARDIVSSTKVITTALHSGGCFTRDGEQATPADNGQNTNPPRFQIGSSPFFGAQFVSCQNAINLSYCTCGVTGNFDFYQVRWSRPGLSEQQFTTHFQEGVTFTNAQFSTVYSFKIEGCNNSIWSGSSCSQWSPTVTVATYYPGDCHQGYVWRGAIDSDHVCVSPATRDETAYDNSQAATRVNPTGAYGPDTCVQGFVWRGAVDSDRVCVPPNVHAQVVYDNTHAAERVY